ncbi:MAG: zf-HC2 domain-containing protein [bacterium]|nr:MAG: zf-HC2 domain-containing protein [bacterium]
MSCQDFRDKLELYLDNELSDQEKAEFEKHLSRCSICAKELEVLKSISSFGKIVPFSEPPPEYWDQLSQDIMQQIGEPEEKISWIKSTLERLRRIIWQQKMSYRFAGLAATAVIVFFIVRISFFREGKFELPIEIGAEDAIQVIDRKAVPAEPQSKVTFDKDMLEQKKEIPIAKKSRHRKDTEKKLKSIQIAESKSTSEPPVDAIDEHEKIATISENQIQTEQEKEIPFRNAQVQSLHKSTSKKKEMKRFSVQPTAISLDQEKTDTQLKVMAARPMVKQSQLVDSTFIQYNKIFLTVQRTEEISEKIKIWEDFLNTNPKLEFIKKAKYEQALLYYELAKTKNTTDEIKKAIKFYMDNAGLLFSGEKADSLTKKIEALNFLLKKIEKNE